MKSFEREVVEASEGHWPEKAPPTEGYLRHSLRAIGIDPREMNEAQMRKAAKANGLDFVEKTAKDTSINER